MSDAIGFEIDFLPVGNGERSGDAIAIRYGSPGDYKVLVYDGGTKESGQALVDHIKKYYGTTRVDYVVNSHPDSDHASGLSVVLEQLEIGELWMHQPWKYSSVILDYFKDVLRVPIAIDTDVNAAALAEWKLGAARGLNGCVYFTVGTGIGGGVVSGGKIIHGLVHLELGHVLLRPMPNDPLPQGVCPFHIGCAEGLACGVAMERRWGSRAEELPNDHPAWELEADYLAQLCADAVVCYSPERIVMGGGVMHNPILLPMIRQKTTALLGGYVKDAALADGLETYIVAPGLGDNSGAVGALLLAAEAIDREQLAV